MAKLQNFKTENREIRIKVLIMHVRIRLCVTHIELLNKSKDAGYTCIFC